MVARQKIPAILFISGVEPTVLLVAVTLFQPRIPPVVIAVCFPESTSVFSHKFDTGHPLSALPEVEAWNDKSDGITVSSGKDPVSYTHLRAHETKANLVCRLLL